MRINHEHKFIFVSTPKCGTNTMYDLLDTKYNCQKVSGNYHHTLIPNQYKHYYIFGICRNPLTRMVSLWLSTTQQGEDRYGLRKMCIGNPDIFLDFVTWIHNSRPKYYLTLTQTEYLQGINFNKILKLENLAEEFAELFFANELPIRKLNSSVVPYEDVMTQTAENLIRVWAKKDFERFNYE